MFPCIPGEVQAQLILSLYPGVNLSTFYSAGWIPPAWSWTVCHTGSWIYRDNRYCWVVGRRHHHEPVHWIRYGNRVAFVPIHPRDVKDHPPVNHKSPVFVVGKGVHVVEKEDVPTGHAVELLKEPPRGFRTTYSAPLARAEEPRMEANSLKDLQTARSTAVRSTPVPITFDHKTQTFMTTHQEMQGGRMVTVNAPMDNHNGTLQAKPGGFVAGGGGGWAHGGGAGSSPHGGGGAAGGGGVHGGGTISSGSSGGAHSGGSAPSSSGGSSGGAAPAASSGGNHH
jgi:hypothetical protein